MTSSDVWDAETAAHYDAELGDMGAPEVVQATALRLRELAGGGSAVEFAIGTGRIAIPLAQLGTSVHGIELSQPMIDVLQSKINGINISVVQGDMATTRVPGEFTLVYVVFNSISNLRTQSEQVACFRNASAHLAPGGRFVVELWVPPLRRMPPGQSVVPFDISSKHLGFDHFDVVTQACESHHYTTLPDGTVRHDVGHFRYAWPAELDLMAELAGMTLEHRYGGWDASPFTDESASHVSVYRKA